MFSCFFFEAGSFPVQLIAKRNVSGTYLLLFQKDFIFILYEIEKIVENLKVEIDAKSISFHLEAL